MGFVLNLWARYIVPLRDRMSEPRGFAITTFPTAERWGTGPAKSLSTGCPICAKIYQDYLIFSLDIYLT
jgi:hypothetical protein